MISEVVNTLFLTYLVTEYLLVTNDFSTRRQNWQKRLFQTHNVTAAALVAVLNLVDRLTGAASFVNGLLQGFLHLPKVIVAALCYVITLYADCKRTSPQLGLNEFLPKVGWTFLKVLPAYPFLAVLISFVFLFLINIFEFLNLPLELVSKAQMLLRLCIRSLCYILTHPCCFYYLRKAQYAHLLWDHLRTFFICVLESKAASRPGSQYVAAVVGRCR